MTGGAEFAPRVRHATLRNGLQVYLLENHANTTVDLVGLIEGGLFAETRDQAGTAHAMAMMLDRGTRRRSQAEIADLLESCGAALRYALTTEALIVRGRCLAEDLPLLIELLGETLREPSFPADQLALVREETLVGLREAEFDAHDRALRAAAARSYGDAHPYARHPLGSPSIVAALQPSDLRACHAARMAARATSLAIVGDIEPRRTQTLLDAHLGALSPGSPPAPPGASPAPPGADTARVGPPMVQAERIEIPEREQIELVCLGPGIARGEHAFEAAAVGNFILGGSFVSRLNQRLRDRDGLTYDVRSLIVSGRHRGLWYAATGVAPGDLQRATDALQEELERWAREGIQDEELAIAQQHLTGAFPIKLETNRVIAAVLLDGVRSGRGLDYIDRYRDRIAALDRQAVEAGARRLIGHGALHTVSAGTHAGA
ncbi:MAG: hypothetical protein GF330_13710 [Candidatus Eisenbacteria bacterium]|nr:hypothetical protein [Candidatus Eisenbacteria bacterium]